MAPKGEAISGFWISQGWWGRGTQLPGQTEAVPGGNLGEAHPLDFLGELEAIPRATK